MARKLSTRTLRHESLTDRRLLAADLVGASCAGEPPAVEMILADESLQVQFDAEAIDSVLGELPRPEDVLDAATGDGIKRLRDGLEEELDKYLFDPWGDADNPDGLDSVDTLYTLMSLLKDALNGSTSAETRAQSALFHQLLKDYTGQDSLSSLPEGTDTLTDYIADLDPEDREALTQFLQDGMNNLRRGALKAQLLPGY